MLTTLKVLSTAPCDRRQKSGVILSAGPSSAPRRYRFLSARHRSHAQSAFQHPGALWHAARARPPIPPRSSWPSAMAAPLISNVFFGQTAEKWVFNVYLPVKHPTGEDYLLTLTQNAESMAKAVNRETLSPGWNAALVDGDGNVIVSSDPTGVRRASRSSWTSCRRCSVGVGEATARRHRLSGGYGVLRRHRLADHRLGASAPTVDAPATLVLPLAVAWRHHLCRHCHCGSRHDRKASVARGQAAGARRTSPRRRRADRSRARI